MTVLETIIAAHRRDHSSPLDTAFFHLTIFLALDFAAWARDSAVQLHEDREAEAAELEAVQEHGRGRGLGPAASWTTRSWWAETCPSLWAGAASPWTGTTRTSASTGARRTPGAPGTRMTPGMGDIRQWGA